MRVVSRTNRWIALGALGVCVAACPTKEKEAPSRGVAVLARVNGSEITQADLDVSLERSFGEQELSAEERKTALESLVLSRALAQSREKELKPEELQRLERKVAAYREEVLVRDYLKQHSPPEPVTTEQAETYYREHPEQFGAGSVKRYELIVSERELSPNERTAVLQALAAGGQQDWSAWAQKLRTSRLPLAFATGRGSDQALHPQLRQLIAGLEPGQVSAVTFVEGRAYLVRVLENEATPPVPFERVAAHIKELLAPVAVKHSLEEARGRVLPSAKVEYLTQVN